VVRRLEKNIRIEQHDPITVPSSATQGSSTDESVKKLVGTEWTASWTTPAGVSFTRPFKIVLKADTLSILFPSGRDVQILNKNGNWVFTDFQGITYSAKFENSKLVDGRVKGVIPFGKNAGRKFSLPLIFAKADAWQRLDNAGAAANANGAYTEAVRKAKNALKIAETFNPEDPRLATSL